MCVCCGDPSSAEHAEHASVYILDEVVDDGVDGLVWQRVLLVEQRAQEDAVCAAVVHLGNLDDRGGRVQQRNGVLGENARDDRRLTQTARPALNQQHRTTALPLAHCDSSLLCAIQILLLTYNDNERELIQRVVINKSRTR